jgi:thiosulfate/3-mercaptopyruvate sulfurtransferase
MLLLQKLVTTAWLAAHLADPHLVILHVGRADTYAQHIPGAQRTDLAILSANAGPNMDTTALAVEMLPPDVLRSRLESYGITDRSTVVVYAGNQTSSTVTSATRVVFTLRVAGLGRNAALLDGGLPVWKAEGRPLTDVVPRASPGHITATPMPSLVVDAEWVKSHLERPGIVVVDARDHRFYDGSEQGESRYGHIPSAHNLPFNEIFDDAGKVKSSAALQSLFQNAGAQPGDTIVAYCHIGMQATAVLFAADHIGYPVKLYDGSFQDWSARNDLPVVDPMARSR